MSSHTLADMTPAERNKCVGMWCDNLASTTKTPSPVVLACVQGERCWVLHATLHGEWSCFLLDAVSPRFDLPRAWTPGGKPVPGVWQYHPAYTGVYQDGTTSLDLVGVETYSKQLAEWECAELHRDDPAVRFFPVRSYATDWEEA